MKIISVVGARPNFMKIAPFMRAVAKYQACDQVPKVEHLLVHTGQHYDHRMSESFFEQLGIPQPDINLEIGSGTHAEQVGHTMIAFEKVLYKEQPDWVVVVGDVNATIACSVTAKKLHIKVCHLEAGLRSGDMTMPEEINRIVTDRVSDLLLTPDHLSSQNLRREGMPESSIQMVGNIMIDSLLDHVATAEKLDIDQIVAENKLSAADSTPQLNGNIAAITMHRPSNVDEPAILSRIVEHLMENVAEHFQIVWPVHPRTASKLKKLEAWDRLSTHPNIHLLQPVSYHEMLRLNMAASFLLTDSGGLQEESTYLGTPCLTMRFNTERPITLVENGGSSILVGNDVEKIKAGLEYFNANPAKKSAPENWDGKTAERVLNAMLNYAE